MAFRVPAHWASRPSPNHSPRTSNVTAIVVHADASSKVESSLDWIRRAESKVSYHVLIGRSGLIYSIVSPDRQAWHAGVSTLDGLPNVNRFSVGVCLSNRNDGVEAYPMPQQGAAADVCAALCLHYHIPVARIVTHAHVAPGRKTDPKGLDMERFRDMVAARMLTSPSPRRAA